MRSCSFAALIALASSALVAAYLPYDSELSAEEKHLLMRLASLLFAAALTFIVGAFTAMVTGYRCLCALLFATATAGAIWAQTQGMKTQFGEMEIPAVVFVFFGTFLFLGSSLACMPKVEPKEENVRAWVRDELRRHLKAKAKKPSHEVIPPPL